MLNCFCNNKDYCNGDEDVLNGLEIEPNKLVTCVCQGRLYKVFKNSFLGDHCDSSTCLGELCSYVTNHKTNQTEQV